MWVARLPLPITGTESDRHLRINEEEPKRARFMTAVSAISRFVLRTGAPRSLPSREDEPIEDTSYVLPLADEKDAESVYDLTSFLAESE